MRPRIFLSAPAVLQPAQKSAVNIWLHMMDDLGFAVMRLERPDYRPDVWGQLQRLITTSDGVLALGFDQSSVCASARPPEADGEALSASAWTSPWIHVEASLGIVAGLPVLAIPDPGVAGGIFDPSVWVPPLYGLTPDMPRSIPEAWALAVKRGQRAGCTSP